MGNFQLALTPSRYRLPGDAYFARWDSRTRRDPTFVAACQSRRACRMIHIHSNDGVAAGDVGLDNVIFEVRNLLSGGQTSNADKKPKGSVHDRPNRTAGWAGCSWPNHVTRSASWRGRASALFDRMTSRRMRRRGSWHARHRGTRDGRITELWLETASNQ